jgi:hypothetical protein
VRDSRVSEDVCNLSETEEMPGMPEEMGKSCSPDTRLQVGKKSFQLQTSRKVETRIRWCEVCDLGMGLMELYIVRRKK